MKRNASWLILMALLVGALMVVPTSAQAQSIPISQTIEGVGNIAGTLTVTSFGVVNGVLTAFGTFTGTLTDLAGNITNVTGSFTAPVSPTQASCEILTLNLGPIHLDLLGLVVDLSPVDLTITAQPGSGNLLGNLLCAVARLLDRPDATVNAIAALLNRILDILG